MSSQLMMEGPAYLTDESGPFQDGLAIVRGAGDWASRFPSGRVTLYRVKDGQKKPYDPKHIKLQPYQPNTSNYYYFKEHPNDDEWVGNEWRPLGEPYSGIAVRIIGDMYYEFSFTDGWYIWNGSRFEWEYNISKNSLMCKRFHARLDEHTTVSIVKYNDMKIKEIGLAYRAKDQKIDNSYIYYDDNGFINHIRIGRIYPYLDSKSSFLDELFDSRLYLSNLVRFSKDVTLHIPPAADFGVFNYIKEKFIEWKVASVTIDPGYQYKILYDNGFEVSFSRPR